MQLQTNKQTGQSASALHQRCHCTTRLYTQTIAFLGCTRCNLVIVCVNLGPVQQMVTQNKCSRNMSSAVMPTTTIPTSPTEAQLIVCPQTESEPDALRILLKNNEKEQQTLLTAVCDFRLFISFLFLFSFSTTTHTQPPTVNTHQRRHLFCGRHFVAAGKMAAQPLRLFRELTAEISS